MATIAAAGPGNGRRAGDLQRDRSAGSGTGAMTGADGRAAQDQRRTRSVEAATPPPISIRGISSSRTSAASRRHRRADMLASGQPARRQSAAQTSARRNGGERARTPCSSTSAIRLRVMTADRSQRAQRRPRSRARTPRPATPAGPGHRRPCGLYSAASLGRRSWRIRARVRERSALVASSRKGWPSAAR